MGELWDACLVIISLSIMPAGLSLSLPIGAYTQITLMWSALVFLRINVIPIIESIFVLSCIQGGR